MRNRLGSMDELRLIEVRFGVDDPGELRARYNAATDALQSDDIASWMATAARPGVSADAADHFEAHWLESPMVCTDSATAMRATFQSEFGAALTAARDNGLKTSMEVMVSDSFDVDYCVVANAAAVIIAIPASAVPPAAS